MQLPRWQWWCAAGGVFVFFLLLPFLRTVYWRGVTWWWQGSPSADYAEALFKVEEITKAVETQEFKDWRKLREAGWRKYFKSEPALIIARADPYRQLYFINRGRAQGVAAGQAALSPSGFITAQVEKVWEETATILLLTDNDSRLSARILEDSAATPLVLAGERGLTLRLLFVGPDLAVRSGNRVISGGQDKLVPLGLPLGEVATVEPSDREGLFQKIIVRTSSPGVLRTVSVLIPTFPAP